MQVLHIWILVEPKQSRHYHARMRKWKQRVAASQKSKAKERERDRVRKKRCMQGESKVTGKTLSQPWAYCLMRPWPTTMQVSHSWVILIAPVCYLSIWGRTQHFADLFVDFNKRLLCHLLIFSPHK